MFLTKIQPRRLLCRLLGHAFAHGPWTWDGHTWHCLSVCSRCGLRITGPVRAYGVPPS
jgi:hypothetical protein